MTHPVYQKWITSTFLHIWNFTVQKTLEKIYFFYSKQSAPIDNNIRPLTDGFDLGIINRQADVNNVRDLDDRPNDGDPGNCDALGLQDTFEKVIGESNFQFKVLPPGGISLEIS